MATRPQLTGAGLLSEGFGRRPCTVRLREEKQPGTNVVLDYTLADGTRRKESLGYPVRREERRGRRTAWAWNDGALERAREEAEARVVDLRRGRLHEEVQPQRLTVGRAFDVFLDEDRGGLPTSKSARYYYRRAADVWRSWLGEDTPWNRIKRSDVDALMRRYAEKRSKRTGKTMIPTGLRYVEVLRTCYNWLDQKAGFEDLRDPTKGFDKPGWKKKHEAFQPRYTPEEMQALVRVRHEVDPRFALFLAFIADSIVRPMAVRMLWRSHVDCALAVPPSPEQAPFGWVRYPALKKQRPVLHNLTSFQRRELQLALDGYLRELEALWRDGGTDYPLFPAVRMANMAEKVVQPEQTRAYQAIGRTGTERWLAEAERAAKVEHVPHRLYYGFRRGLSDYLMDETDLKTLTVAGGWSSQRVPEQTYIEKLRHKDRANAREALERRRRSE